MSGLPESVLRELKNLARRPEGTFEFTYTSESLFDPNVKGGVVFEFVAGAHVFRLDRTSDLQLRFIHASPGTGTRIASLNLKETTAATKNYVALVWSTREIRLHMGPENAEGKLSTANGAPAPFQLQVAADGSVFQIGDQGVQVMGATVYVDGQPLLTPTANQTWNDTLQAVSMFLVGCEEKDYAFRSIATNLTLGMLVTGFETYCQKRFLELEREGIAPNIEALVMTIYPKRDRDAGILNVLKQNAADTRQTVAAEIVSRGAINFQNYDSAKRAFNKAYGLRFGDIGLPSETLDSIQRFIRYRHRIVHVSPLIGILNQPNVPPEEPVFPTVELARKAAGAFNAFVSALHNQSLTLRRVN